MPRDLFIAYTPYQLLLSYAISARVPDGRQEIYIVPAFPTDAAHRLTALISAQDEVASVEVLPGKFDGDTKKDAVSQRRAIYQNIDFFRDRITNYDVRQVFASVDTKEVVQAAMYHSPHNVYVEDGTAAYSSNSTGWMSYRHPLLNRLMYRLRSGFWWEEVSVYGSSRYIDEVRAVYPAYLRPEIADHEANPIDRDPLRGLADSDAFVEYFSKLDADEEYLQDIEVLVVLPHSSILDRYPQYSSNLSEIHSYLNECHHTAAFKAHPTDTSVERLFQGDLEPDRLLPKTIPMELLYSLLQDRLQFVVGDVSTSLYTGKWLCDDVDVICTGELFGGIDQQLSVFFDSIGIQIVNGPDQVRQNILEHERPGT